MWSTRACQIQKYIFHFVFGFCRCSQRKKKAKNITTHRGVICRQSLDSILFVEIRFCQRRSVTHMTKPSIRIGTFPNELARSSAYQLDVLSYWPWVHRKPVNIQKLQTQSVLTLDENHPREKKNKIPFIHCYCYMLLASLLPLFSASSTHSAHIWFGMNSEALPCGQILLFCHKIIIIMIGTYYV